MTIITVMLFFAKRNDFDALKNLAVEPVEGQTVEQYIQMNSNYFQASSTYIEANATLFSLVTFAIQVVYFTLFWATTGQTIGIEASEDHRHRRYEP
jgi:hypothetical protein